MEKVEDLEEFVVGGEKGFSECRSECQSGWTSYLCQSQDDGLTNSSPPTRREVSVHEDEEEDLSMLSDASSGPPHAAEEDCINFYNLSNDGDGSLTTFARNGISKRRKAGEENQQKQRRQLENSSLLDDTASSPLLCFSKSGRPNFGVCPVSYRYNRSSSVLFRLPVASAAAAAAVTRRSWWRTSWSSPVVSQQIISRGRLL